MRSPKAVVVAAAVVSASELVRASVAEVRTADTVPYSESVSEMELVIEEMMESLSVAEAEVEGGAVVEAMAAEGEREAQQQGATEVERDGASGRGVRCGEKGESGGGECRCLESSRRAERGW